MTEACADVLETSSDGAPHNMLKRVISNEQVICYDAEILFDKGLQICTQYV